MAILSSPITLIQAVPPVTRYFTISTLLVTAIYHWITWKGIASQPAYLVLVPGSSIFYPWTFISSALVEENLFDIIVTLLIVPPSLRYFERIWGSLEILKFVGVCVGVSNLIAFALNWAEYLVTENWDFLYQMEYRGQKALHIAVLVAFTQLIPEHQVQVLGFITTRVKHLPMALLGISTVLTLLGMQCPWVVIQFGWFVSWVYLRFYKKNSSETPGGIDSYGDRSETFSLASWFPSFAQPPISALGNFVYRYANRFRLIPAGTDVENGGYTLVPGGARAEAERRRALALKALDQRLAATTRAHSPVPGPSQPPRTPSVAGHGVEPPPSSSGASRAHDQQDSKNSKEGEISKSKGET